MVAVELDSSAVEGAGLEVTLDRPLPGALSLARRTALFCVGTCFHRHRRVTSLAISVNGVLHRPIAQRMPRLDLFRALHPTLAPEEFAKAERDPDSARDPEVRSYRSGFWATVPVGRHDGRGELELGLEARLEDGSVERAALGTIAVIDAAQPPTYELPRRAVGRPLIAICMATFNPDIELFRTQIESIRAQTDRDWVCLISDDRSSLQIFEAISETVAGDERFILSRAEKHLGFYRNFERALGMLPPEAEFVALSDHDDRWYPDKLEALREAIGAAELAYSDVRRVDATGRMLAPSLWQGRRNNYGNLASLLISNTIPGAACMFRRRVVDHALPFPSGPGWNFHDHWLVLVAMALGDVAYVGRSLYDYVQHPGAVLGRVASTQATSPHGEPAGLRTRLRRWRGFLWRWRSAYFGLYLQREFLAQVLLARGDENLIARKRRALWLVIAAGRSPLAFAWLAARPVRGLFGRNETLGIEAVMAKGILWRHAIALGTWGRERPHDFENDASMPSADSRKVASKQQRWLAPR